jgi:branched-chain amino acid aminotransferase
VINRLPAVLLSWVNGEWVDAPAVPMNDRGFQFGDGATDSLRTFGGEPFGVAQHVKRLFETLAHLRIAPAMGPADVERLTRELCERNAPARGEGDFWVTYFVSRAGPPAARASAAATFALACTRIDFGEHAAAYAEGRELVVPKVTQLPPSVQSPRMKTLSRLHLTLAQLEAERARPGATALLLDHEGNLAETVDGNLFLVRDGVLLTPFARNAVAGVTRATTIELARARGIAVHERDLQPHDALTADEAFIASTGYVLLPVPAIDGVALPPRPRDSIYGTLLASWRELLGFDFVAQAQAPRGNGLVRCEAR